VTVKPIASGRVRRACIDIGTNTTRLLVADCGPDGLGDVHQDRAFTRIGADLRRDGSISAAKIAEVADVVRAQLQLAREFGSADVRAVATAAIRRAANGPALLVEIENSCGLVVDVLSGEEEARLAFVGAARTLEHKPTGALGVVDVGGGSSEVVVGVAPDQVQWSASISLGSGDLADQFLRSDPPPESELSAARARVDGELAGLEIPHPVEAVAVGGSATSLCRLAGPLLDAEALGRSLGLLARTRGSDVARRFGLDRERVRLLPAGLLILEAVASRFGVPLAVARGGIREGVLLEAGARCPSHQSRRWGWARRWRRFGSGRRRAATGSSSGSSPPSTPTSRSRRGGTSRRSTPPAASECLITRGSTSRSC
jgi:exopolyphosphatase/guanosine-5'-triphosphate,3'-diphosphate pyrophosphatase